MRYAFLICLVSFAASAWAQDSDPAPDDSPSLMEQGLQMFMDGLRNEMAPALEDMGDMAEQFGPAMKEFAEAMGPGLMSLMDSIQDWGAYETPEVLPNGDIIIRRKPDTPQDPPDDMTTPKPESDDGIDI